MGRAASSTTRGITHAERESILTSVPPCPPRPAAKQNRCCAAYKGGDPYGWQNSVRGGGAAASPQSDQRGGQQIEGGGGHNGQGDHIVRGSVRGGIAPLHRFHRRQRQGGGCVADTENIDIDARLLDGMTIDVPAIGDEKIPKALPVININTADAQTLCLIPGIGEVISERIIKYREENGEFTDISQIMNVNGIGEKTFAKIKDFIKTEETQK